MGDAEAPPPPTSASSLPTVAFHDAWAAIAFLLQLGAVLFLCTRVVLAGAHVNSDVAIHAQGLGTVALALGVLAVIGTALGTVALSLLLRYSAHIIEGVLWAGVAGLAVAAVLVAPSNLVAAAVLAGLSLLNLWYLHSVRSRIAFTSAVLSTACAAIKHHYVGIVSTAYLLLLAQLAWVFAWSIAAYGVYAQFVGDAPEQANGRTNDDRVSTGSALTPDQVAAIAALCLSLHWGSEVLSAVCQVTVGGTDAFLCT